MRAPELWYLVQLLLQNPSSRFHAAVAGWEHPLSYEGMYQLDLLDLLLMRWSEKGRFRPVPRPWDSKRAVGRSAADALRILRPHLAQRSPGDQQDGDAVDDSSSDGETESVTA